MFAAIVETAIISVAAIVIAALATGNAIHKRVIAWETGDEHGEERRLLERERARAIEGKDSCIYSNEPQAPEWTSAWETIIRQCNEELLKLARREEK